MDIKDVKTAELVKKYNFNLNALSYFAYNISIRMQYLHIYG